jgi:hypothetical protein
VVKQILALTMILIGMSSIAIGAQAALISGVLTTADGHPASDRQIHFEDRVSGTLYLVRTTSDGAFSADLPPGFYDLRRESGPVIRAGIAVDESNHDLGKVPESEVNFWSHLFELESLGERVAKSPAPATANLPGGGAIDMRPAAAGPAPTVSGR